MLACTREVPKRIDDDRTPVERKYWNAFRKMDQELDFAYVYTLGRATPANVRAAIVKACGGSK